MAIAFDGATDGSNANATTLTWSHTCSGSNRILFVECWAANADRITGVTYNGVAMTLVGKAQVDAGIQWDYLFYLLAPATGANNVVVTASPSDTIAGVSTSYTGAKQSAQPDSSATQSVSSNTTITQTTTVVAANCWLVGGFRFDAGTPSAGGGTTFRMTGSAQIIIADSNGVVGTGSQALSASVGGNTNWGGVVASFQPDTGGGAGVTLPEIESGPTRGILRGMPGRIQ